MHHRYSYDADNRIEQVQTSVDGVNWYTDAEYFYYPHGPLERVELGNSKVQGVDYAYTLQGWLKGINGDLLNPLNDMGLDGAEVGGNANKYVGRDAFAESIGYYGEGDYSAIDADRWSNGTHHRPFAPIGTTGTLSAAYTPLYNGNIAHTVNSLEPFAGWTSYGQTGQVLAQVYRYDQLNRLRRSQGVMGLTASTNSWNGVHDPVAAQYRSTYEYDANGNILYADRWDLSGHRYDSLYYRYQMNGGHLTSNRLYQLLDLADQANSYANDVHDLDYSAVDIIDQNDTLGQLNVKNNYSYDPIGNLVKDSLEQIQRIDWTVAGKVKAIERTSGSSKPELSFGYGADGQRTIKTVGDPLDGGFREHYIRDAQGNIMATYQYKVGTGGAALYLMEQPLYGSKRLGSYTELRQMLGTGLLPVNYTHTMQAVKEHYELDDHLGNVAAVVTGRLLSVPGGSQQAELVSAQGYEAFGSLLPGRNYSSDAYRFGFNGKLKDDEVHGATGTSYDYGFRMYDPRIIRFLSIDPLTAKYPFYSPYQFAGNSPIEFIDLDGLERAKNKKNTGKTALEIYTDKHGEVDIYDPKSSYGNKRKHDATGWGFGQLFHSLLKRAPDRTSAAGGGVVDNPLDRESSRGEDRTLNNRIDLYPTYKEGNLKLDYSPGTDEKGNPVNVTYEIGIVDADGNEHPIATAQSDKTGALSADFKLNDNEYLYQRTTSLGKGGSATTSATAPAKSINTDDGQ